MGIIVHISFSARACGVIRRLTATSALTVALAWTSPVLAQSDAFTRSLAEASAADEAVAGFYRDHRYQPLWTGPHDQARRHALIMALSTADEQGLPVKRYDPADLIALAKAAVTEGDRGRLEMAMTSAYLSYARDVSSGALTPKKIDPTILREIIRPDPAVLLAGMAATTAPDAYLRALLPTAAEYARLVKEKLRLEREAPSLIGISAAKLSPGDSGNAVVALRDRLIELGYMGRSATATYDGQMQRAVQRYQLDQGLAADGVAGGSTIDALNTTPAERLQSVTVALERMRWMAHTDLGKRHIWVNQADFTAEIVDDGRVTFQTRVVVGKASPEMRSPEFSDQMEYMVINPSWGVPRSIIVKEYLPMLQRNPNAVGHLQVIDGRGRVVPRGAVNFAAYSASSFPFGLRQPPSDGNALGKVKFMFPNPYNIYLHDTPAKALFANEVRAFSHGCIRLGDPFDFAYTLLAKQTNDPKGLFQEHLDAKNESSVSLDVPVPVHLVYYTAWPTKTGMAYRRDVYGRDGKLFEGLTEAGVALPEVQG
ncbi:L,D-transpeptidase family protein [Cypionkella psychrotolerans]|uniref:L,D-transpeptidase family protein n=1 Tax=Cypionkella psychrotolerans TaxID=1678131 RepID=UPI0006B4B545|nr:L,D-transpeptidase family protein [Cypionkella psychrotolerans]